MSALSFFKNTKIENCTLNIAKNTPFSHFFDWFSTKKKKNAVLKFLPKINFVLFLKTNNF